MEKTTSHEISSGLRTLKKQLTAIPADPFVVRVHFPASPTPSVCFFFLLNILKLDVSYAVSMNMKSIQIKPKGKDTALGPLIQLGAALFGALCW